MRWAASAGRLVMAVGIVGCDVTLARELSPAEASSLVARLSERGIAAVEQTERAGGNTQRRVTVGLLDVERALEVVPPRSAAIASRSAPAELPLVPSRHQERQHREQVLATALEHTLERLPGVREARLHVSLPLRTRVQSSPDEPPRASALLVLDEGAVLDEREVKDLIAGAVPNLDPQDVTVVRTKAPPPSSPVVAHVRIGPITVTRESAPWLRALLGACLLVQAALAAALVLVVRRARRASGSAEAK